MADAFIQFHASYMADQEEKRRNERINFFPNLSHPVLSSLRQADNYKLRDSKWFYHDEISVVCSVFENGFIVERHVRNIRHEFNVYGIVMWDEGFEHSKDPNHMNIHTVIDEKHREFKLLEFWREDTQIKISNGGDRDYPANDEETIKLQLERAKKIKFERDERFVVFCRYQEPKKPLNWSLNLNKILSRLKAIRWR